MRTPLGRGLVAAGEVRAALDRVCASAPLASSPKLICFLRYVVEMTLAGRGDRLKGYTIGVEALGRRDDFDPQADPIVRVEASRLRAALARYYGGLGARDSVCIELPRGGYVPRFTPRQSAYRDPLRLLRALRSLSRLLHIRITLQMTTDRDGPRLPLSGTAATTGPNFNRNVSDGRQDQQAQSAPAARTRRPRPGRDRGDAAHDRGDPRGL